MLLAYAELVLYEGFALTLFYTCFCRIAIMSRPSTQRAIRWSFALLGGMSIVAIVAPLFEYEPGGMSTALLGVFAVVQVATSYHWRHGVPPAYRQSPPACGGCVGGKP